jgi:hypothetical protein
VLSSVRVLASETRRAGIAICELGFTASIFFGPDGSEVPPELIAARLRRRGLRLSVSGVIAIGRRYLDGIE